MDILFMWKSQVKSEKMKPESCMNPEHWWGNPIIADLVFLHSKT